MFYPKLERFQKGESITQEGMVARLNSWADAIEDRTPQIGHGTRLQTIPGTGFSYSATPQQAGDEDLAAWDLVRGTATGDWQLNPGWVIDKYTEDATALTINDVTDDFVPLQDQVMYLEFDYETAGPGISDLTECTLNVGTYPATGNHEWDTSSPPLIEFMRFPLWSFHDPTDLESETPDVTWSDYMVTHGCKRQVLSSTVHAIKHAPDWPSLILFYVGTPEAGPTSSQMRATPFLKRGPIPLYGENLT